MEDVTDTPAPDTEPVQSETATEETATITCDGCGYDHDEDDSCDTCYFCTSCETMHHPDNSPICESCANRYLQDSNSWRNGWRHCTPRADMASRCSDSCDRCFYCESCSERHNNDDVSMCNNCESCTENHNCIYCGSCGEYRDPEDMCGNDGCDSCSDHCDCASDSDDENTGYGGRNPQWLDNPVRFHYGKPTVTMPSRRTVAAEIEVAGGGRGAYYPIDRWSGKIVRDGSVTNGYEINTAPATGDQWETQINEICGALNGDNARVTTDCGLHIHVGAHDYSYMDHIRLLWAWEHIEKAVFACLPPSRQNNTYCGKRADSIRRTLGAPRELRGRDVRRALVAAIRDGGEEPYRYQFDTDAAWKKAHSAYQRAVSQGKPWVSKSTLDKFRPYAVKGKKASYAQSPGGTRYFAINLQALFEHGTIEFRCHSGTTDAEKIRNWGQLCAALVDFAKRANIRRLREFRALHPFDAMLSLVPTETQKQYWRARRERFA